MCAFLPQASLALPFVGELGFPPPPRRTTGACRASNPSPSILSPPPSRSNKGQKLSAKKSPRRKFHSGLVQQPVSFRASPKRNFRVRPVSGRLRSDLAVLDKCPALGSAFEMFGEVGVTPPFVKNCTLRRNAGWKRLTSKWSQLAISEASVAAPMIVSGQVDVFPLQWREMHKQLLANGTAAFLQRADGAF